MNKTALLLLLALPLLAAGESPTITKTYHHCTGIPGRGNSPHLFDTSEIYTCDEGAIEVSGTWDETIEYGYVFTTDLGRPDGPPHRATQVDYDSKKWCADPHPWDPHQMVRCGDKPTMCWDGRMGTWDPQWQGFSCVTPDHHK